MNDDKPLDGILLVGDNVYPCGVRSVDDPGWRMLDPLRARGVSIYAVLGNHDYCGDPAAEVSADGVIPQWHMPARQYVLRSDVADLAMLDTTPYATGKSRDAEDAIRATFAGSSAPWRIAVGHHTIISSGWHGWFPRAHARRMREILPFLRHENVALYVCGHDHDLELIEGSPRYLISGAGSDPIPIVKRHAETIYPKSVSLRERIGFAVLEITSEAIRVRFHRGDGRPSSEWIDVARH